MHRTTTRGLAAALLTGLLAAANAQAGQVDVDAFAKLDSFEQIKLSPGGDYFAATVPFEDRTALAIMSRADRKLLGTFQLGRDTAIYSFDWVSPGRVLIGTAQKFGELDEPQPTGELFAMDASGGKIEMLLGQRAGSNTGSRIGTRKGGMVAAFLIDDLPRDDDHVLVMTTPFGADPYTKVERLDVNNGQRQVVARVPARNARFMTDNAGVVRFALATETDVRSKLFHRAGDAAEWDLVNDEAATHVVEVPIGFAADNATAYLEVENRQGPDSIVAFDPASGKRTELLRDKELDPLEILYKPGTSVPIGAMYDGARPRVAFFDEQSPEARTYRSLQAAFGDNAAIVTSSTADGRWNLVQAWSDRNPGDFYLFDAQAKKADYVVSRAQWFDPAAMAAQRALTLPARDGRILKGYLTVPHGASGRDMPMVVMPHGGPFGISDAWGFDSQAQMLAAAGYAVLQVNFRGSGGRGREFRQSGARQWGLAMQDDVTDATKWAVAEGIADPKRVCLYGASYGAFAALMGVAREPSLYRCAAGYVGVYDLVQLAGEETRKRGSIATWTKEWIGDDAGQLAANSPTRRAAAIKVPVLLAAGREDPVAPVAHTEAMERALKSAGVDAEVYYYAGEGHGFYKPGNRVDFYRKLLAFLAKHLGGATAAPADAGAGSK